ncbi:diguanylate cyclase domain-containing protein [Nonomuraea sp. NPDC051941]|uniref:diguanylate cyclase domain-containing protein n=1 Tax=Nonomuraea sp. NPDC051941 TaxID=3364373 RepID=UPI0037CBFB77
MFADVGRVNLAREHVDRVLRAETDVSIIAIDLDRSAVVRRRGVAEKRLLVTQLHQLIRSALPGHAVFLDSGSRDEGWIVLTSDHRSEAQLLAERLRTLIPVSDFRLSTGEAVRLTASFGVVRSPMHGRTGQDLLWSVGEALWQAKLTRDTVHLACTPIAVESSAYSITVDQKRRLTALAQRTGRSVDSLLHEALQLLLENHAPRWHWIVEKRGPVAGMPLPDSAASE